MTLTITDWSTNKICAPLNCGVGYTFHHSAQRFLAVSSQNISELIQSVRTRDKIISEFTYMKLDYSSFLEFQFSYNIIRKIVVSHILHFSDKMKSHENKPNIICREQILKHNLSGINSLTIHICMNIYLDMSLTAWIHSLQVLEVFRHSLSLAAKRWKGIDVDLILTFLSLWVYLTKRVLITFYRHKIYRFTGYGELVLI